eukprot:TRINITY_DN1599_c0_g1_i1.p1 TRINITY_DN1599_c0_g1~~TRINITY_DN1599_c0_g1_i1.p1  ORF type:complete len:236 (-),score=55.94 TRINITY_DN1599_c0_g1_i1:259-966(-)
MAVLKNMLRLAISRDLNVVNSRFGVSQLLSLNKTNKFSTSCHLAVRKDEPFEAITIDKGSKRSGAYLSTKKTEDKENINLKVIDIDQLQEEMEGESFRMFPDEKTADQLFDGVRFSELPYVNIRMHKNNTKLIARTWDNKYIFHNTPSFHGFVGAKKKTAVGGQVAGSVMGQKLRGHGFKNVRVRLNGFNQARDSVVKGITQAGINIVAIMDSTTTLWDWPQRGRRRPAGWRPRI